VRRQHFERLAMLDTGWVLSASPVPEVQAELAWVSIGAIRVALQRQAARIVPVLEYSPDLKAWWPLDGA
jgi:hypothetical protein